MTEQQNELVCRLLEGSRCVMEEFSDQEVEDPFLVDLLESILFSGKDAWKLYNTRLITQEECLNLLASHVVGAALKLRHRPRPAYQVPRPDTMRLLRTGLFGQG